MHTVKPVPALLLLKPEPLAHSWLTDCSNIIFNCLQALSFFHLFATMLNLLLIRLYKDRCWLRKCCGTSSQADSEQIRSVLTSINRIGHCLASSLRASRRLSYSQNDPTIWLRDSRMDFWHARKFWFLAVWAVTQSDFLMVTVKTSDINCTKLVLISGVVSYMLTCWLELQRDKTKLCCRTDTILTCMTALIR